MIRGALQMTLPKTMLDEIRHKEQRHNTMQYS